MLKRRKSPAPTAGPKQNTRIRRKSTSTGNPLNRPAPNPTGGVAGGPSAPTRRPKLAGGTKFKAAVLPRTGARPGAKPPTAAQKKYAQEQTAKSALRAQGAKLKAKAPVLKGLPRLGKMKPGTGTAPDKYPNKTMPVRKPKPKTAKRKSPFAKGRPTQGGPRYTTMPVKGAPKRPGTPVKRRPKTGGIAMSEAARKAMAFRKVAEAKKAARVKRTGESLATTAAQVRARKAAAAKRKPRPTGGPRRPGMGRRR